MSEQETGSDSRRRAPAVDRAQPGRVARTTMARATEWSSDRVVDPGDSHDKGEQSLCVGEAA